MTAVPTRPLFADASPAEIRAALLPDEQPDFDREYQHALEGAATALRVGSCAGERRATAVAT